jgi:hypothetical protein
MDLRPAPLDRLGEGLVERRAAGQNDVVHFSTAQAFAKAMRTRQRRAD